MSTEKEKVLWHTIGQDEVLQKLDTSGKDGLTAAEAAKRLEKFGPNALAEGKKKTVLQVFLGQFKDLLVIILIAAALISMATGEVESTIVIFAVLILNAVLGTVQHFKAEKSLESLKAMSAPSAKVVRDGRRQELPSHDIVPGDLVELEAGDMVVADGRILENFSLKVNESSLTGESEAVEKSPDAIPQAEVALGDRKDMVFSGSLVTYGRAVVVVTGTGMDTELGKVAALMNQTQQRKTPLQQSLDDFSKKLAIIIMAICVVVFGLNLYHQLPLFTRDGVLSALMFAVALAVAAIPEALSSIVTIVQAMGTQKMARENAIIKDLKAVETLGAVSIICSDKTGTLTQNRMTPQKLYADRSLLEGHDLDLVNSVQRLLLKAALLASDATTNKEEGGADIGDPTEVALVMLGDRLGIDEVAYRSQHPRLGELAFDSDRKLMSTLHDVDGTPTLFTKGAIDVLLDRSKFLLTRDGPVPMTPEEKETISRVNMELSMQGLRVLAFAYRELDSVRPLTLDDENDFTFIGLISMIDPPRPEAIQAVADAKQGGIRTIMITGDHKVTASAIARQLGIFRDGDEALSGVELDNMTDADLDQRLEKVSVYARVSPEHKIRIVSAWQRKGKIVSMTGDGVNDAPALKAADIDPGRRQLRHHRQGGGQRPGRLHQHQELHQFPALRQHGRHPLRAPDLPAGAVGALRPGPPALHQSPHRLPTRHRHRRGARHRGPAEPEAPGPQGAHPQPGAAGQDLRLRRPHRRRRYGGLLHRPPGRRGRPGLHPGLLHPDSGPALPRLQLPGHPLYCPPGPHPPQGQPGGLRRRRGPPGRGPLHPRPQRAL